VKHFIIFTLFYSTFSIGADVCSNVSSSDQVFLCSEYKKNLADNYLNGQYTGLRDKIKSEYINDNSLKNEFLNNIKESQRNWIKFRDSNCKLYALQIEHNSQAHQTTINECIAKMSELRGKELAEIANGM
jgi:uncharacterized protein YecT (DUF1311 family)